MEMAFAAAEARVGASQASEKAAQGGGEEHGHHVPLLGLCGLGKATRPADGRGTLFMAISLDF